jgi:hypothetical protein
VVEDATFCDLDRDMARMGTWHDEDGDMKAWQDGDDHRGARTGDDKENEIVLKNLQEEEVHLLQLELL